MNLIRGRSTNYRDMAAVRIGMHWSGSISIFVLPYLSVRSDGERGTIWDQLYGGATAMHERGRHDDGCGVGGEGI